ncbi:type 2 DNA topoisomerase 6 subunit B-like [Patagioenas fasciata]|uniref:type 2 DNA topoisomerase 6 subunit B-like n=1 Tax=Patagioenas fasciata TaxID=372321 RepID=UPI0032E8EC5C
MGCGGGPPFSIVLDPPHVFLYDPGGLPCPRVPPHLLGDPSCVAEWPRFGLIASPHAGPQLEQELAVPDVTYVLRQTGGDADGGQRPQTLLLFLFLRHHDPFQPYDSGTRGLLQGHLEPVLSLSRPALERGLRRLLHPLLRQTRRRERAQQRVSRSVGVAVAALSAVVTASTSSRFRRSCLDTMQVTDTAALVVAAQRSLAQVTQQRRLHRGCRDPPGDTPRGSPHGGQRQRRGRRRKERGTWLQA